MWIVEEGTDKNKCCHFSSALNINGWCHIRFHSFFLSLKKRKISFTPHELVQPLTWEPGTHFHFHFHFTFSRLSTEYAFQFSGKYYYPYCTSVVEPFAINPPLTRLLTDPNRLAGLLACLRVFVRAYDLYTFSVHHFPYGKLKLFFKRKMPPALIYDVIVQLTTSKMKMSTVILTLHVVFKFVYLKSFGFVCPLKQISSLLICHNFEWWIRSQYFNEYSLANHMRWNCSTVK